MASSASICHSPNHFPLNELPDDVMGTLYQLLGTGADKKALRHSCASAYSSAAIGCLMKKRYKGDQGLEGSLEAALSAFPKRAVLEELHIKLSCSSAQEADALFGILFSSSAVRATLRNVQSLTLMSEYNKQSPGCLGAAAVPILMPKLRRLLLHSLNLSVSFLSIVCELVPLIELSLDDCGIDADESSLECLSKSLRSLRLSKLYLLPTSSEKVLSLRHLSELQQLTELELSDCIVKDCVLQAPCLHRVIMNDVEISGDGGFASDALQILHLSGSLPAVFLQMGVAFSEMPRLSALYVSTIDFEQFYDEDASNDEMAERAVIVLEWLALLPLTTGDPDNKLRIGCCSNACYFEDNLDFLPLFFLHAASASPALLDAFGRVRSLHISGIDVSPRCLVALSKVFTGGVLEELKVSYYESRSADANDGIYEVSSSIQSLLRLQIDTMFILPSDVLKALLSVQLQAHRAFSLHVTVCTDGNPELRGECQGVLQAWNKAKTLFEASAVKFELGYS